MSAILFNNSPVDYLGGWVAWVDEDFDRQEGSTGAVGASAISVYNDGWHVAASGSGVAARQSAGSVGHAGILRITTSVASLANHFLFYARDYQSGALASEANFAFPDLLQWDAWVRVPTETSCLVRVGMGDDISNATFGANGAYFEFNWNSSFNLFAVTRASSSSTTTDTRVAVAANTWYRLTMRKLANGTVRFYINGLLVATHSTNITAANVVAAGFYVQTNTGSANRSLDIDKCRIVAVDEAMLR